MAEKSKPSNKPLVKVKPKIQVNPFQNFVNMSLEQLFNEPVNLSELDEDTRQKIRKLESSDDFSFILELDLEDLFSIPVSIRHMQDELESPSAGPQSAALMIPASGHGPLVQITVGHNHQEPTIVTKEPQKPDTKTTTTEKTDPTLPPVIVQEPENPINPVGPLGHIIGVNETDMFIHEVAEFEGNLFSLENLFVEQAMITSVLGVTQGGPGDLGEDPDTIFVRTTYGFLEINIYTGEFYYWLDDVSEVNDAQLFAGETIPIIIDLTEGGTIETQLDVVIDLNQAPQANDDAYLVNADQILIVNDPQAGLLGNDTDPDNTEDLTDLKFVTAINGDEGLVGEFFNLDDGGRIRVNYDGTFNFDPQEDFDHLLPGQVQPVSFTYTMQDAEGLESTATVVIDVVGVLAISPPLAPLHHPIMTDIIDMEKSKPGLLTLNDVLSGPHTLESPVVHPIDEFNFSSFDAPFDNVWG